MGQTTGTLKKRFSSHITAAKRGSTLLLHSAIRMCGKDAFTIELLEECCSFEESDAAEQRWITELNTISPNGYNVEVGGFHNRGPMSEATREKLREAAKHRSPEWYDKICHAARNRSPEWKKRLSESRKGLRPTARQLECLELGRLPGVHRPCIKGENNPNCLLTSATVSQIRELYATGKFSQERLGQLFGVKQVTISAIVRHKIWKDQ